MKVTKAVIVAAGLGTRMLPATKAIPKEVLPVVNTPAIQLVVEEAVRSGIKDIVMILSVGKDATLDHFNPSPELETYLENRNKRDLAAELRKISHLAGFTRVEQKEQLGLGHAVLQARDAVGGEPFAVMLPDDIFDCARPCLSQLLEIAERREAPVVALQKVPREDISKYGIVSGDKAEDRLIRLTGMVEKPSPDKAPTDLAIMGRYVLPPEIFDLLAQGEPGAGGEIQLTDSLIELAERRPFYGYEFEGVRYDLGNPLGFLTAQVGYGLKRADLADRFRAYLKSVISS